MPRGRWISAVYLIPREEWYIIPYEAMGERLSLHFTPGSRRSKWVEYREAWELLRVLEIQACVDPEEKFWGCLTSSREPVRGFLRGG
jgi:hypothetical protein